MRITRCNASFAASASVAPSLRRFFQGFSLAVFVLAAWGCGSGASVGSSGGNTQPSVTLKSIAITPSTVALDAGQTQQLTATGDYSDGTTKNLTSTATWSSSGTSIATISSAGLVTSLAQGTASVSATFASVTGSVQITVNPKALVSIAVTPGAATLIAGQTQQLSAIGAYTDGSTGDLTSAASWSSSNASIAAVSSSGLGRVHTIFI